MDVARTRWTEAQAADWYDAQPWMVGFNYAPRTAVNQLEMWQPETWDPDTIDEELGWAADIGFNTARVFLHDLPWEADPDGFLDRIDAFLDIADSHDISVMLVIFDGVWNPEPVAGAQPEPTPGVHNSQWVQSPGAAILGDSDRHGELKDYVQGVVGHFATDERVVIWDLFNEADNPNLTSYGSTELDILQKSEQALALTRLATAWALEVGPSQPLTTGVYLGAWGDPDTLSDLNRFLLEESDVVSFHSYRDAETVEGQILDLQQYGRPILCTEYMARPEDSTFEAILPVFEQAEVGSWSWGLVDGRTQTIYPWSSWTTPLTDEPDPWFHDVLRSDGAAFDPDETAFIRDITSSSARR